jgi:hypothetical protein
VRIIKQKQRPGHEKKTSSSPSAVEGTFYSTLIANKWQEVVHHYPDFAG